MPDVEESLTSAADFLLPWLGWGGNLAHLLLQLLGFVPTGEQDQRSSQTAQHIVDGRRQRDSHCWTLNPGLLSVDD